jgi:hypothetical protein
MEIKVSEYFEKVNNSNKSGITSENRFSGELQKLLETLLPNLSVTNEPMSIEYGTPNYVISEEGLPIAYIKTTDIGTDLNELEGSEDVIRYKESLSNFITTNYKDFRWYKDGELITTFSIGHILINNLGSM